MLAKINYRITSPWFLIKFNLIWFNFSYFTSLQALENGHHLNEENRISVRYTLQKMYNIFESFHLAVVWVGLFWQEQVSSSPTKGFETPDSKLRRPPIDRQHVCIKRTGTFFFFILLCHRRNSCLSDLSPLQGFASGGCWCPNRLCHERCGLQPREACCSLHHLQMSSSVEIFWSWKNQCLWSSHSDVWFSHRGTQLLPDFLINSSMGTVFCTGQIWERN